ncbi:DNA polymerase I [Thermithiobacillus plumbiphilus]|uniref:DNA polymerase I n=1 Tax=Thermithiobacillus plumbiphilus TaxID=1729899 RepID=A0ABU9D9X6_9PROT
MNESPIILIDASSFLYRAFHAMPDLRTHTGQPTGAVFGVLNMIRRLLRERDPKYLAAVFDAPGPTFRHERFAEYKAQRPAMPDDLSRQTPIIHQAIQLWGIPLLQVSGVEADDVIGTLARRFAAMERQVLVVTGDKDMAQLVDAHVHLYDSMSERYLDAEGVLTRFGVPPHCIQDYLALVGDTSDNIPGVPGVGPKTAAKWLAEYGSLDALMEHADSIKGKAGESLRACREQLPLCRELATIDTALDLPYDLASLARRPPAVDELRELFRELEFTSWLRELEQVQGGMSLSAAQGSAIDRSRYRGIFTLEDLQGVLVALEAAPRAALDTETTSLNPLQAELVGLSFAWQPAGADCPEAVYIPVGHDYLGAPEQLSRALVLDTLRPWLESAEHPKLAQNFKYDLRVLTRHGIHLQGIARDTMLESYVLDSTQSHDLDSQAEKRLQHQCISFAEVAGKGRQRVLFSQVAVDTAIAYAAEDADVCYRLDSVLWPQLEAEERLKALFKQVEMPLVPVLARMEDAGVRIDPAPLALLSEELAASMAAIEGQAHAIAAQPFNINSPKQIQEILFDKLQIPVTKKTPGGAPSTSEEVLSALAENYELPRLILEYRSLSKLKSTYADALPRMIDPATGRVHTSFHQAVTSTGRLSSSDPNLQNIPARTQQGRRIRQAFVAAPGHLLISADYSQIELRIMAHLSGEPRLLKAFAEGEDVHTATAAEIFGVAPEAVDGEQRRRAKAVNFGLIYGMSAFGLARELKIDRNEAQRYVDRYFERYPGVRRYMDSMREQAREKGYVETLFGRRLYVPDIHSSNANRRNYAERTAINAPMQGTAADLIKLAMIAVDAWLAADPARGRMILQVHDELVLEVPEAMVGEAREALPRLMCGVAQLAVPLESSVGVGANWEAAH